MEDRIKLSYFYGREADQYSFYRIPKLLFTEEYFKKISVEAKVLYGLMLDRMSLSMMGQDRIFQMRFWQHCMRMYRNTAPALLPYRQKIRSRLPMQREISAIHRIAVSYGRHRLRRCSKDN